jgi:hypothetical protein
LNLKCADILVFQAFAFTCNLYRYISGWRDDRMLQPIPSRLQPVFDVSDKVFVSFTRMMRTYPTGRAVCSVACRPLVSRVS